MDNEKKLKPKVGIHPGKILERELEARDLTIKWLIEVTQLDREDLDLLVREAIDITSEIAFELKKALGTSKEFWLNLQRQYDEATKTSLINAEWVVVGQPWGDGTTVNAFAQDAAGQWVAECDFADYDESVLEEYLETPHDIAGHIAAIHNAWWEKKQERSNRDIRVRNQYNPDTVSHPGETLLEWLGENDQTLYWLADETQLPFAELKKFCDGVIDLTDDIAREVAIATKTPEMFWINRQKLYDKASLPHRKDLTSFSKVVEADEPTKAVDSPVVAVIGSERFRKLKDNAIAIFLNFGYRVLDICREYERTQKDRYTCDLIICQSDFVYLVSDGYTGTMSSIYVGVAYANYVPVVASTYPADSDFRSFIAFAEAPQNLTPQRLDFLHEL